VERGVHNEEGKCKHVFNVPEDPGPYYVTMGLSLDYHYVRVNHNNTPENAFALIYVLPQWKKEHHRAFPKIIRDQIWTVLLIAAVCDEKNQAYHPECLMYRLPKDVLYRIFSLLW